MYLIIMKIMLQCKKKIKNWHMTRFLRFSHLDITRTEWIITENSCFSIYVTSVPRQLNLAESDLILQTALNSIGSCFPHHSNNLSTYNIKPTGCPESSDPGPSGLELLQHETVLDLDLFINREWPQMFGFKWDGQSWTPYWI